MDYVIRIPDGVVDGILVGVFEGAVVGVVDGSRDGVFDGVCEGAFDGAVDGSRDGVFDGVCEGGFVGAVDGVVDGSCVGVSDGALVVGFPVGALVGSSDGNARHSIVPISPSTKGGSAGDKSSQPSVGPNINPPMGHLVGSNVQLQIHPNM